MPAARQVSQLPTTGHFNPSCPRRASDRDSRQGRSMGCRVEEDVRKPKIGAFVARQS
jgi:hypothetical protein